MRSRLVMRPKVRRCYTPAAMTTPLPIAQLIMIPALQRTLGYAHKVLDDIPADRFAFRPHPTMNHPAFYVGHLTLYPARLGELCGQPDVIESAPEAWTALFAAGTECADDDGRYPGRDELLDVFYRGYASASTLLEGLSDAQLHQPNPLGGPISAAFPTVGLAAAFLTGHHLTLHLGQISAWRRAAGLPSAM